MTKTIEEIIKEIKPTQLYTPTQIAKNKWLYGYAGKNSYFAVLDLIKQGKIIAKNFGRGKVAYWKVLGSDLIEYTKTYQ